MDDEMDMMDDVDAMEEESAPVEIITSRPATSASRKTLGAGELTVKESMAGASRPGSGSSLVAGNTSRLATAAARKALKQESWQ
jgi:hypothetical protein